MTYITVLFRLILPLLFVTVTGGIYSYITGRKFVRSLAPVFCALTALMMITGMMGSVNAGLITGTLIIIAAGIFFFVKRGKRISPDALCAFFTDYGYIAFVIIYLVIWAINYGKHYDMPDEFSHWGLFLREVLRIDKLYCASPWPITHKTYLPAVTIFEALWCRLSLGYSEANAFRGIQMLGVSMILPMAMSGFKGGRGRLSVISLISRLIMMFGIPLFFAYSFYHSIYQDLIFGVFIAYCLWVVLTDDYDVLTLCELAVVSSIMIMSKMPAIFFFVTIVVAYVVRFWRREKFVLRTGILMAVPLILWFAVRKYTAVMNPGGGVDFNMFSPRNVISIITHDGALPYQAEVDHGFVQNLFHTPVAGSVTFIPAIIMLLTALLIGASRISDAEHARLVRLTALWTGLCAIGYLFLLYLMVPIVFCEAEAVIFLGYERYMASFIMATLFVTVALFYEFRNGEDVLPEFILAAVLIGTYIMFGMYGVDQLFPGQFEFGREVKADRIDYESEIDHIVDTTGDDASIVIINRGMKGGISQSVRFYLMPRNVTILSPGPAVDGSDTVSMEMSADSLKGQIEGADLVFFMYFDDYFTETYSGIFTNPDIIENGALYSVTSGPDGVTLVKEGTGR